MTPHRFEGYSLLFALGAVALTAAVVWLLSRRDRKNQDREEAGEEP
jgi:hypothetical protein